VLAKKARSPVGSNREIEIFGNECFPRPLRIYKAGTPRGVTRRSPGLRLHWESGLRRVKRIYLNKSVDASVSAMKTLTTLLLAIFVALAGVPHAFCACGCGGLAEVVLPEVAEGICPHCCNSQSRPEPSEPSRRCKCQTCEVVESLPPGPANSAPSPEQLRLENLTQTSFLAESALAPRPEACSGTAPPGHFMGSRCALVLLLGRLLL
jgi:hypothetical protein